MGYGLSRDKEEGESETFSHHMKDRIIQTYQMSKT